MRHCRLDGSPFKYIRMPESEYESSLDTLLKQSFGRKSIVVFSVTDMSWALSAAGKCLSLHYCGISYNQCFGLGTVPVVCMCV